MLVALAATSALGHQHFGVRVAQVGQQHFLALGAFAIDERSHGQVQHQVVTLAAIALAAFAGAAVLRLIQTLEPKVVQRKQAVVCLEIYRTTVAAVAAVRAATRHEFFAPKRQAPVPALAGTYLNSGFINKSHALSSGPMTLRPNIIYYMRV